MRGGDPFPFPRSDLRLHVFKESHHRSIRQGMRPRGTRTRLGSVLAAAMLASRLWRPRRRTALQSPEPRTVPAEGPGSPLREGNRLVVEVRFDHGALAALDELRAAGSRVLGASRRYQTVTVAVRPRRLRGLTALDGVEAASARPDPAHASAPAAR